MAGAGAVRYDTSARAELTAGLASAAASAGPCRRSFAVTPFRGADKSSLSDPAVLTQECHLGFTLWVRNE